MAKKDSSSGGLRLNRRNFLRTTGVVGLAAETIAAPGEAAAQSAPAAVGLTPEDIQRNQAVQDAYLGGLREHEPA